MLYHPSTHQSFHLGMNLLSFCIIMCTFVLYMYYMYYFEIENIPHSYIISYGNEWDLFFDAISKNVLVYNIYKNTNNISL